MSTSYTLVEWTKSDGTTLFRIQKYDGTLIGTNYHDYDTAMERVIELNGDFLDNYEEE